MKTKRKLKIIIIVLGIIFTFLSINNFNIFNDQGENNGNVNIQDEINLKTADSEIIILTPENRTYREPMSGYYPATYGFENDVDGAIAKNWWGQAIVESSYNEHNKVVKHINYSWNSIGVEFDNQTSGTIEFYFNTNNTNKDVQFNCFGYNPSGGTSRPIILGVHGGNFQRYSSGWLDLDIPTTCSINTWYHIRIDFDCDTDTWNTTINGELKSWDDPFDFGDSMYISDLRFYQFESPVITRFDAIGFSWDSSYEIGNNRKEGLLLSFKNTTDLDWIGYSLDRHTNKTILGNTTIPMPDGGTHSIQVFGNETSGIVSYSNIRYFTTLFSINPIYIAGNAGWSSIALAEPWCSGSGTWSDPYLIEYISIDGQETDSCLHVTNSNVPFIIRNSFFYNGYLGGIFLTNVDNGQIVNNNCSKNYSVYGGIYLYNDCSNNTISENILSHNNMDGLWIEHNCYDNIISGNLLQNNDEYGIRLIDNSDNNNVTENYLYFNIEGAIFIGPSTSQGNRIERNVLVSKDKKFIDDEGTNTVISLNHELLSPPRLYVEQVDQLFSLTKFIITINISSEIRLDFLIQSIQMWWNGIAVPLDNITELGNGLYNVTLTPIFVNLGDDPILLNMTISAKHHQDKYFETYIAVISYEIIKFLHVEIIEISYSTEDFNFTFFIYNETGHGIDSVTIQMWWDGIDVSIDVQNIGNGYYFVSLDPITVALGEEPILLNMTISAPGYEDKYFETYIAVHPSDLEEDTLELEIIDQSFSTEQFNITFFMHNTTGYGIEFATIQMWWNGEDVSSDIQNLGDGIYFISLESITVLAGEDPILLNMTISAMGYEDKYFETYIAVDPASLLKGDGEVTEEFPLPLIIIISVLSAGAIIGLVSLYWLRKRKRKSQ